MKGILLAGVIALAPVAVYAAAPMSGSTYVMKAGASDQYELQSSKLVLNSTKNAAISSFAKMMVADHTKSTADVKAAAAKSGVKAPPPALDAMGKRNIAVLKAASATERDRLYISQQKVAHQQALALHQGYAADGSVPALKAVASTIAPVVQKHVEMLSSM